MPTLKILSATQGDNELYYTDDDPEKRQAFWKLFQKLQREGSVVFIINKDGGEARRVMGYDSKTNEYLVVNTSQEVPESVQKKIRRPKTRSTGRVSAEGIRPIVIPQRAGG